MIQNKGGTPMSIKSFRSAISCLLITLMVALGSPVPVHAGLSGAAKVNASRMVESPFTNVGFTGKRVVLAGDFGKVDKVSSSIVSQKLIGSAYDAAKRFDENVMFSPNELTDSMLADLEGNSSDEIAQALWKANDNIDTIYTLDGQLMYIYAPLSVAVQLAPDATPDNWSALVPKRVVIGHSEVKDFLGMTAEAIRVQVDAFLAADFKIILPWGDFPLMYKGKDYLKSGQRKFPAEFQAISDGQTTGPEWQALFDEVSGVMTLDLEDIPTSKYEEVYNTLAPTMEKEINKIIDDAVKESKKIGEDSPVGAIHNALYAEYGKYYDNVMWLFRDVVLIKDGGVKYLIKNMLANVDEVRARIVREISNIHDINSQIRVLFEGLPMDRIIAQISLPYEPVEGIRTVAINAELQALRMEKMLDVMVEVVSGTDVASRDALKALFIYGGGANEKNIGQVTELWLGAFIGRASLDSENAATIVAAANAVKGRRPTIIFNFKAAKSGPFGEWVGKYRGKDGMDLEKGVKVIHAVSMLDAQAAWLELTGNLGYFLNRRERGDPKESIVVYAGAGVATQDVGAFDGHVPAKFLYNAGVTHAVVDPAAVTPEQLAAQRKNLADAGIIIVEIEDAGEISLTPISQVRRRYAELVSSSLGAFQKATVDKRWKGGGINVDGMQDRLQTAPSSAVINIPADFDSANLGGLKWNFGFMSKVSDDQELEKILGIE